MSEEVIDYLDIDGVQYGFGWAPPTEQEKELIKSFTYQDIDETPIGAVPEADLPKETNPNKFVKQVLGVDFLPIMNQGSVGSCVSYGGARALELTNIIEIANGDQESYKPVCRPLLYGFSRVEIGGGRLRGDGSNGIWLADACRKCGILPQEGVLAGIDLSDLSPTRFRTWGSQGIPDKLEPYAKEHLVHNTTLVKTWESAKKALANGNIIAVCSDQGFSTSRDNNGICKDKGNWSHCMCLLAFVTINNKEYGVVCNSWGKYMSGPAPKGFSDDCFLADGGVVNKMLGQGDSFAFGGIAGFEKKDLDWSF